MNFRRSLRRDEPDINFVPLIDLLLVILIFLMVTTSFAKFSELQVSLPSATAEQSLEKPLEIAVTVGAESRYSINGQNTPWRDAAAFAYQLSRTAQGRSDAALVIYADAGASHQSVVNVLEAARQAGLAKVSFATQSRGAGAP